jgi:hypothetical protein
MRKRTREENSAHSRLMRERRRVPPVPPSVPPTVSPIENAVSPAVPPVSPVLAPWTNGIVPPVPPTCMGCRDKQTRIKLLLGRIEELERNAREQRVGSRGKVDHHPQELYGA